MKSFLCSLLIILTAFAPFGIALIKGGCRSVRQGNDEIPFSAERIQDVQTMADDSANAFSNLCD